MEIEKLAKGLKACTEGTCLGCPYDKTDDNCNDKLLDNALEIAQLLSDVKAGKIKKFVGEVVIFNYDWFIANKYREEPGARLLTLDEIMGGKGGGWIEEMFSAEPGEGYPEDYLELHECAYCMGSMIQDEDNFTTPPMVRGHYNKKYGFRVWTQYPSEELRKATEWEERA